MQATQHCLSHCGEIDQLQKIYKDGQTKPQVVVFVGTLVRDYAGIGLTITGSSPCKWYINLDIPDVLELKERFSVNFQPIKWVENAAPAFNQDTPEEKTIKEILKLNPHKYKIYSTP
ncbi:Os12g0459300 [Oryza sativa Japonica Group]|uniref:Os12g0459300 protein n=2 Tax=Oryza sativa subsp. japonica TaxID=39947 RepID=C7JAC1_ORYSJ|nr:Os12g0459300 [Oryza sativa Japonica Group]BAT17050.1 Os12g0459300 [Oryza sativa Japonica Group]|eukprot:NP_001176937.1 Os12g0459300 [Oryza sativa Japonica Group]